MKKTKFVFRWGVVIGLWSAYIFWLTLGLPSEINYLVHIGFIIAFVFSLCFIVIAFDTNRKPIFDNKRTEETLQETECQVFEISEYRTYKIKDADLKLKQC
jgi:hypothetical protein